MSRVFRPCVLVVANHHWSFERRMSPRVSNYTRARSQGTRRSQFPGMRVAAATGHGVGALCAAHDCSALEQELEESIPDGVLLYCW